MRTRTPQTITEPIRALIERIVPGGCAQFVDIRPRADGTVNECFSTVTRQVAENGGTIQHGWTIWEWPEVLIEAEFHAVWRSLDNPLLCVTPRTDGEERILFVTDPTRTFTGLHVDNVRMALGTDPRIAAFIRLAEKKARVMSRGIKGSEPGQIRLPVDEIEPIKYQLSRLQYELSTSNPEPGPSRNQPCRCGSGKIFKKCHGRKV